MPRKDRNKSGGGVKAADRTGESMPLQPRPTSAGGSSQSGLTVAGTSLMQMQRPGTIQGPSGERYLTKRNRTLGGDEVQLVEDVRAFDIQGQHVVMGDSSFLDAIGPDIAYPLTSFWDQWYPRTRMMGEAALKYKHVPLTITDGKSNPFVARYWNTYYRALANLVTLLSLEGIWLYNDAFQTLAVTNQYPRRAKRVREMYKTLSTVRAPATLKAYAIQAGVISYFPGRLCPHMHYYPMVSMDENLHAVAPASIFAAYDADYALEFLSTILQDADMFDSFLADLSACVTALASARYDDNADSDYLDLVAVNDLINMVADIVPGLYSQGLPDDRVLRMAPAIEPLSEMYCGALFTYDPRGVLTGARYGTFPAYGDVELSNKVCVKGFTAAPSLRSFGLWGLPKFGVFQTISSRVFLRMAGSSGACAFMVGTDRIVPGPAGLWAPSYQIYTREDDFVTIDNASWDKNTGTDILAYLNSGSPELRHTHAAFFWASQLETDLELRFLENEATSAWQFWLDPADLIEQHFQDLCVMFGIPYLGAGSGSSPSGGAPEVAPEPMA